MKFARRHGAVYQHDAADPHSTPISSRPTPSSTRSSRGHTPDSSAVPPGHSTLRRAGSLLPTHSRRIGARCCARCSRIDSAASAPGNAADARLRADDYTEGPTGPNLWPSKFNCRGVCCPAACRRLGARACGCERHQLVPGSDSLTPAGRWRTSGGRTSGTADARVQFSRSIDPSSMPRSLLETSNGFDERLGQSAGPTCSSSLRGRTGATAEVEARQPCRCVLAEFMSNCQRPTKSLQCRETPASASAHDSVASQVLPCSPDCGIVWGNRLRHSWQRLRRLACSSISRRLVSTLSRSISRFVSGLDHRLRRLCPRGFATRPRDRHRHLRSATDRSGRSDCRRVERCVRRRMARMTSNR